jgi:uncharacterized membrane protein YgdD (TMEM256/DUF423 family)
MRVWLFIGAVNGALAVTLGAAGAHILSPSLADTTRAIFETAVRYHLVHSLALLAIAALSPHVSPDSGGRRLIAAGAAMTVGIVLFCGGLYALSAFDVPAGANVAPFGGMLLIAGWLLLASVAFTRANRRVS